MNRQGTANLMLNYDSLWMGRTDVYTGPDARADNPNEAINNASLIDLSLSGYEGQWARALSAVNWI